MKPETPEQWADRGSSGHLINWLNRSVVTNDPDKVEAAEGKLAEREAKRKARAAKKGWGRLLSGDGGDGGD